MNLQKAQQEAFQLPAAASSSSSRARATHDHMMQSSITPKRNTSISNNFSPVPYNCGQSENGPDRRPVLFPNCCGNTLCMQCAESHRTAKVTEMSGNDKKIPCPFCNAPFHSERERFVVNKFALGHIWRGGNTERPAQPHAAEAAEANETPADTYSTVQAQESEPFSTDAEWTQYISGSDDRKVVRIIEFSKESIAYCR